MLTAAIAATAGCRSAQSTFNTHGPAASTANVYAAAQPGQSLDSLTTAAPPNPLAVFGDPVTFGTPTDPMVGKAIGGIIVFAGGLPLY
jgi:hypothetical protein